MVRKYGAPVRRTYYGKRRKSKYGKSHKRKSRYGKRHTKRRRRRTRRKSMKMMDDFSYGMVPRRRRRRMSRGPPKTRRRRRSMKMMDNELLYGMPPRRSYYGMRSYKRRRSRFGRMPNLGQMMGNYRPSQISGYQEYLGMTDPQRLTHTSKIPKGLRANFYAEIP